MNTMAGALARALANKSRIRAAPRPTYIRSAASF